MRLQFMMMAMGAAPLLNEQDAARYETVKLVKEDFSDRNGLEGVSILHFFSF